MAYAESEDDFATNSKSCTGVLTALYDIGTNLISDGVGVISIDATSRQCTAPRLEAVFSAMGRADVHL